MKKPLRELVFKKYDGHCAYCGSVIEYKNMHVDHIKSRAGGGTDDLENLNPSCRYCNNWKREFSLEQFRHDLEQQVERLNRYSANFRMAKRYRLVSETINPVIFYFERQL